MLADQILDYNSETVENRINIKGILVGNACTHPLECYNSTYYSRFTYELMYTRGFLDKSEYMIYVAECKESESTTGCINQQKILRDRFYATGASIYNIYGKCFNVTELHEDE